MLPPNGWQYQNVDRNRSELLMRVTSLDQLVAEVFSSVVIEGIVWKEQCNEAKREKRIAHRVTFSLRPIDEAALDATDCLLNGAYGLRARYCHSAEEGSKANKAVCRSIADAIREGNSRSKSMAPENQIDLLADALGDSLLKPSAKVWFDPSTDKRAVRFEDGEVLSQIWTESRANRTRVQSTLPQLSEQQIEASLAKGRGVPRPLALNVKAAFINPYGLEYLPASKRTRHMQIHLLGWT